MIFDTARFGQVETDDQALLTFPHGLYGFEAFKGYFFVDLDTQTGVSWLQSSEEPGLAFPVAVPFAFFADYDIEVDDGELDGITSGPDDVPDVWCVVTAQKDTGLITMNLKAPLLISARTRRARQVILSDVRYSTREPLGGQRPADLAREG